MPSSLSPAVPPIPPGAGAAGAGAGPWLQPAASSRTAAASKDRAACKADRARAYTPSISIISVEVTACRSALSPS